MTGPHLGRHTTLAVLLVLILSACGSSSASGKGAPGADPAKPSHPRTSAGPTETGTVSLVVGDGQVGEAVVGHASATRIGVPTDVAVRADGSVYFTQGDDHRVLKVSLAGEVTVVAGNGQEGSPQPGPALESPMDNPFSLAFDSKQNLYITDESGYGVVRVTPAGELSYVAGTGEAGGTVPEAGDLGPATDSHFDAPVGMAIDASDNIYFADNDAVWKVTPSGDLTTVAGSGQHAPTVPGPALSSPFDGINDVAVDAHGTVFVAESFQVLKITPDGNLSVVAGTGEYGVPKPGLATKSPLAQPEGLAVDDAGNLYIVNQNGDSSSDEPGAAGVVGATLVKVSPEGELAIVMGGHGNNPATPGPASSSPLGMPWGLGIDAAGNVYVADGGLVAKVAF